MHEMEDKLSSCQDSGLSSLMEELELKALEYTSATGSYTAWRTDVNLDSPNPSNPFKKEDEHINDYYNSLQYSLYEHNLPETVDRTKEPRKGVPSTSVSIVLLSSPVECLAMLLEGSKKCPGDMLLVLSPTWLIKEKSKDSEGLFTLFIKKAITFDRGGCSYLDVFEIPRRCTYLVNFFTRSCTDGQRNDGEDIERGLDCPMSSSLELCKRIDDKLLTRIWMAESDLHYPETLAFAYKPAYTYPVPNDANIRVVTIDNLEESKEKIAKEIKAFLDGDDVGFERVVVKPSGPTWKASRGVSFHDVLEFDKVFNSVIDLMEILEAENTVLVEAFHEPPKHYNSIVDDYACRIRVCVCREHDNTPIMTQIVCGIGKKVIPINGDNTIPLAFESAIAMWSTEETDGERLYKTIKQGSQKLMERIIEEERKMSVAVKGGPGAQTDLIGVDYVLSEIDGQLEPVGIEVNSHDCIIVCQFYETINPERQGETVQPLLKTMMQRSQMYAIHDKTVMVVGAGGYSKRFIWDSFADYGIKVVLVDPDETSYAASKASIFIQYDFVDHTEDQDHANNIIKIVKEKGIELDGCLTFWEDCGPLSATMAAKLKLRGPGEHAANIAKKKSSTQSMLLTRTACNPHFPRTHLYAGKVWPIKNEWDIDNAINHVGLPAVLKLEYGSSAVGVKPVKTRLECINEYTNLKANLKYEDDHPGVGLGYGNDMLLMELLVGTEHDVDIVIFDRQLVAAFISDNGPTSKGSCTETTASMPTCLSPDRQGQIITAAYQCCTEIGLVDGVFNVEIMMTIFGPKLIEINARLGGFYLRDWILTCFEVDTLLASFMISLGIRPIIPKPVPTCHLMGTMCVPSLHRKQLEDPNKIKLLNSFIQNGTVRYNQMEASQDDCGDDDTEEPFCNIGVQADDRNQAKQNLIAVCTLLGIHNNKYDLNYYLKNFN